MILSVSRRTDVPALYSDWFFDRLKEGYFLVPNPFIENGKVAKVNVEPVRTTTNIMGAKEVIGNIDGIVFWTKNPKPMLNRLNELKNYKYCFLFTLNPYDETIESDVPPLDERIETFRELAKAIGADRVFWRYDPILFTKDIGVQWHIEQFGKLAKQLGGYTKCCKTSFLIGKHSKIFTPNFNDRIELIKVLNDIAVAHGIELESCAMPDELGIKKSSCIDPVWWEKQLNAKRKSKKLDGGRKECLCMPSVDIGIYNTCSNGCIYCYANGFYGYRGEVKLQTQELRCDVYERKIERSFGY